MEVLKYVLGPIETNAFLLYNKESKDAVLVDAPHGAYAGIEKDIKTLGLKLIGVFVTHGHWDHVGGLYELKQKFPDLTVYAHADDQEWIEDPAVMNDRLPPELHYKGVPVDQFVKAGDVVEVIGEAFQIRHVPGHAPGNVVFYNAKSREAFVGDIIFAGSVGRHDLPGGSFEVLKKSILEQVYTLPDEVILLTGHGPETQVGHEKATNPVVNMAG